MDAKTLKALKASIKKWNGYTKVARRNQAVLGPANCPLCELFHLPDCEGCPVKAYTGYEDCEKTPYVNAATVKTFGTVREFRVVAKLEADFLRSLLPKKRK